MHGQRLLRSEVPSDCARAYDDRVLRNLVFILLACASCAPTRTTASSPPASAEGAENGTIVIASSEQREAAVGREVTIIGVQTRTKLPTVCGVDVDGAYELSDRHVTVHGVLQRTVVGPRPPDAPIVASRGPGVYYAVIDPATGQLAKTTLVK